MTPVALIVVFVNIVLNRPRTWLEWVIIALVPLAAALVISAAGRRRGPPDGPLRFAAGVVLMFGVVAGIASVVTLLYLGFDIALAESPDPVGSHLLGFAASATSLAVGWSLVWWARHLYDRALLTLVPAPEQPEPWAVERPQEVDAVVRTLLRRGASTVGVTTALPGAGGVGKTTVARMVRADKRVLRRFRGRIHWVTVGREVRRDALVDKVNGLVRQIAPRAAYPFADLRQATEHLLMVLEDGPSRLIVLDDVWFDDQLAAFPVAGDAVRLVTTPVPSLVVGSGAAIAVDQMTADQARAVVAAELAELPSAAVDELIVVTGRWPLLLRLVNKILVDQSRFRPDAGAAAEELLQRLRRRGGEEETFPIEAGNDEPDLEDHVRRRRAAAATIEAGIGLLSRTEGELFRELAISAEDGPIAVSLVAHLWEATHGLSELETQLLCSRLAELSLATLSTSGDSSAIRLHEVVRDHLRRQLGQDELRMLNSVFLDEVALGLPTVRTSSRRLSTAWWKVPRLPQYLADHLIFHLLEAGRDTEAEALAIDFRWVEMRLEQAGTSGAVLDLERVGTPRALRFSRSLGGLRHAFPDEVSSSGLTTMAAFAQQLYADRALDPGDPVQYSVTGAEDVEVLLKKAKDMGTERLQAAARAHFAAAARHAKTNRESDERRSRFAALIALSLAARGQSTQSSCDFALAALDQIDHGEPGEAEVRTSVLAYLGPGHDEIRSAVRDLSRPGSAGFDHLVPLLATSEAAARVITETVRNDRLLASAAARYLGRGRATDADRSQQWTAVIERWRRERRRLYYQLRTLELLDLQPDSLQEADELLSERQAKVSAAADLADLSEAIRALRAVQGEWRFDAKEAALRKVVRLAEAARAEVRAAPTELGVAVVHPAAERVEELARELRAQLVASHPPKPQISPALPKVRLSGGRASVQIRVGNAEGGAAPLEAASLIVTTDSEDYRIVTERVEVRSPLRGGESEIVEIVLEPVDGLGTAGTIVFDVALNYQPVEDVAAVVVRSQLSLTIDRDFARIRPNPYASGGMGRPVDDPRMFYGRGELVTRIRERLRTAGSPGVGIAIFGHKRTGKSSVRLHLRRRLRDDDGLPVVDVGNLAELTPQERAGTDRNLLGALLWRILEIADHEVHGGTSLIAPGFDRQALIASPDPVQDFGRIIEQHRRERPACPPWVVLIDEFQYLQEWIRQGLVPPSLLQAFKAIVERRLFHVVLVGQSEMEQLIRTDPNTFGVFGLERVTYLADKDAQALIEEPVLAADGHSRYQGRAVAEILRLTGGNPYYVQRVCSRMVDYMNAQHASCVSEADVGRVIDALLGDLTAGDFDSLQAPNATPLAHRLIRSISAAGVASVTLSAIEQAFGAEVPQGLLDDLTTRGVLRQEPGGYRIVVGLYAEWLRYSGHLRGNDV
ncbi:NB-ARC domain-containing protein [Amycolatopsis sp. cg5]|uniref:NB-ARC domain-containing protein n=1 Tax=Amycolatopsis sp. cg5 TaxID=3238802 RepID=UPI003525353F